MPITQNKMKKNGSNSKRYNVAVVGATGAVGETILSILAQRKFPVENVYPLSSKKSAGKVISYGEESLLVGDLAEFDFNKVQIAFFSAGSSVSADFVPVAAKTGCVVIDNTSEFRYQNDIPLVVTEVNPHAIAEYKNRNIIANPNCQTMQMLVALKPIYDEVGISRINVATYQSVSGMGRSGITELAQQAGELLNGRPAKSDVFPRTIAFNVIPHAGDFQDNGYTTEEMKMVWETQKIFEDKNIVVNPTCVRVPVFYGHSEAVHIETKKKITVKKAKEILKEAPGVIVIDKHAKGGYPTPVSDATGEDAVFVGRIREDISHPLGLDLWVVSDNIRKGAALNAVQIAEILIEKYL
jgi:aspartate-semialdehyde dehydrogenase